MRLGFSLFLLTLFFIGATVSYAQTSVSLVTDPAFPEAGESYNVSISGVSDPFAKVTWYKGGKAAPELGNTRTITLEAKGIGVSERISAEVTTREGDATSVTRTITPVRTDILVSADTLVPPFYKGKRLGSSGSIFTATALTFAGSPKDTGALTYLWRVGNKVQNGGVPSTLNSVRFSSGFESELSVGVSIFRNGAQVAEKTILVPITEPEMHFYEKNPLRGLSHTALKSPHMFVGEELLLRAEAYFVDKDLASPDVLRTWNINNKSVAGDINDPFELTLQRQGGSGLSKISFSLQNMAKLLQGVTGNLSVQF